MKCGSCGADQLSDKSRFCHQCGAPVVVSSGVADPYVGKVIGNYQVLSVIGEGGMGKVYRAEQVKLRRPVCLKMLLPQFARDESVVKRFELEGVATATMRHSNIVSVFDFGRTDDGTLYIVMELVEGKTMRGVLKEESPVPVARAIGLIGQVLSALDEAHANNVVHRDLKPSNILVSKQRDGTDLVKVVDFGIAKLLSGPEGAGADAAQLTKTGLVVGTMGYMAPEQLVAGEVETRSDLYSVAVILWELLTGRRLFNAKEPQQIALAHLTQPPPLPSSVSRLPIPAELDAVVLQNLEKTPEKRSRSALEFRAQLEAVRARLEPGESARPPPERLRFQPTPGPGTQLSEVVPEKLMTWARSLPALAASRTRRPVTVLFAEPTGLSALPALLEPAEVKTAITGLIEGLMKCVRDAQGHVERMPGNMLVATFGLPEVKEDDAARSVFAASQMKAFTAQFARQRGAGLGVSIGVHLDSIVAGGFESLLDDPAMAEVLNVSRRIAGLAAGSILVSQPVQRAAGEQFRFKERGTLHEGGRPLFEFLSAEAEGPKDPLAGRQVEVEALKGLMQVISQRGAGGLMLVGGAGVGKTRLLEEAEVLARAKQVTVARARGGRFGASGPYDTLRELLTSLQGRSQNDTDKSTFQGLSRFGLTAHELVRLDWLLSPASSKPTEEGSTPEQQLLDRGILISLLQKAAGKGPLVLLVDDVHLADRPSLEVIEALIGGAGRHPLGLVATARTLGSEALLPKVRRQEVKPLSNTEMAALVGARLPDARPSPELLALVNERAQGNPLIAREVVSALVEQRAVERRDDVWLLKGTVSIPDSLALLVAARLARLSPNARLLLSWGAVCGRTFELSLVAASVDTPLDGASATEELIRRELLAPVERASAFTFPQVIVYEHVLESLPPAERRQMHARIAESIERGVSSGAEHALEAMARHFKAAELPRKAMKYLHASGDRFFERNLFAPAADAYQQCLALLLAEMPKTGAPRENAVTNILEVGARAVECLAELRPREALGLADKVLSLGSKGQSPHARAEALRQKAAALQRLTRPTEAEAALQEAMALIDANADPALAASLSGDYATLLENRGELAKAAEVLLTAMQARGKRPASEKNLLWQFLNQLGRLHLRLGKTTQAKEYFENALAQTKSAENALGESRTLVNLAVLAAQENELPKALQMLDEAFALAERLGDGVGKARIRFNRGLVLRSMGDAPGARALFEQAAAEARELGWREGEALATQALR